ncbi:MAG: NERD domain-containing protein [Clostridiales bacterium]|nr:NERD domain-containing protein [Clostridiales bacterium]
MTILIPATILLLLVCGLFYGLYYWLSKKRYESSDYYRQTHNRFHTVRCGDGNNGKGVKGEYLTWNYLRKLPGYKKFLFNCYLPKGNGETTEIDVILLHESGIYVFESKNYSGWIFGTETQQYWTQTLPQGRNHSQKEHFLNPIIQNKVHLKWLERYLNREQELFYSYIVFSERCTLKDVTLTSGQHHVIKRENVLTDVKANVQAAGTKLTQDAIDELFDKLLPLTQIDAAQKAAHVAEVAKKKTRWEAGNGESQLPPEICPRCGGKLVLKTATRGAHAGENFWGCSNYPKCRYIKSIDK